MKRLHAVSQTIALNDLAALRQEWEMTLQQEGGDGDAVADMIVALNEAVVNSLRHGYKQEAGPVEIEIWRADLTLQVVLRDSAPLFDPTLVPTPDTTRPLAQRPLGGMGVHMMRNYTDELHYNVTSDGRNQLTLVKYNAFQ